jgi:tetratricopeptide (TPR) repeat protein
MAPSKRGTIAEAHATYRRGRVAYSQHHVAEAEPDLRRAARLFAQANDPMSLAARYYAANTRFDQNDAHGASAELDQLRREVDANPRYVALGAQVRWEIMLCAIHDRDWNEVVATASQAMGAFQRIGEKRNLAVILTMRADALLFLGRPDEAWSDRIASLRLMDTEGDTIRLPIAIGAAADVEIAMGRLESGRALLGLAEEASREGRDYAWLTYILARDAMTAAKLHSNEEALQLAQQATLVAMRVADPALRARAMADAHLAAGSIETASDPQLAIARLSRSVDTYAVAGTPLLAIEAKLLRARAEVRAGDREAARRDLDEGIAQVEKQPVRGTFVDDAGRGLFQEAIALALDRHDVATAFAYAERSRNARAVDVATLQRRLRGSGAAILEVTTLVDETAVFCVTEGSVDVERHKFAVNVSSDLYDVLVRPFETQLGRSRQIIVVAGDTPLQNVAFAALYDAKRRHYVVEEMPVSIAESASSLEVSRAAVPHSVVAVALHSRDGTPDLPGSVQEVNDIGGLYPRAVRSVANVMTLLHDAATVDVIHISGHTEQLVGGGDDALLFDDARLSGSIVASMSIGHPIVVLAACETLRTAPTPRARALSVGGGFLAAGATAVVGTLEPITDNEAREIFRDVHRGLAAGESPAVAVQHAQLAAMARHSTAWRAITLLVSRITNAE